MKLSYNWLKEFLPKLKNPFELGRILSIKVAEVEKVFEAGKEFDKIVVAKILEVKYHPQADKLKIVLVDTGKEKLEIVCGASNIKPGQKVPLALEGAYLPAGVGRLNGMEIKTAVIRGVESKGMLCAEDELGLGPDHQGILILDSKAKVGQPLSEYLGLNDFILEIEKKSLTHRPDLFNHLGFCREMAAILNLKIKENKQKLKISKSNKSPLQIKILDQKLCPRYMAVVMEGIKVEPSPDWLQHRLRNLGVSSINNIVDITNYVLMEHGQPLHAFDADLIKDNKIIVRQAKEGEKIIALDDKEYELSEEDLVIADSQKPIALAGIIGGRNSAINQNTQRIVIESANFNNVRVRRTSWRLGLRTEAVIRFEKELPLIFSENGLNRAIELIQKLTKGKVVSKLYDLKSPGAQVILKQKKEIVFSPEKARKFIGEEIKDETMKNFLQNLGMEVKKGKNQWLVRVPFYRQDLNIFEDLIEEIVRIYGSDKIIPQPVFGELRSLRQKQEFVLEKEIKNVLIGLGFSEVYSYIFYNTSCVIDQERHLSIENPLNKDQKFLRTTLLPMLLEKAEKNINYYSQFKIFEVGHVFYKEKENYFEKKNLAGIITYLEKEKDEFNHLEEEPIFQTMGLLETFFNNIGLEVKYEKADSQFLKNSFNGYWLAAKDSYKIRIQNKTVGVLGENKVQEKEHKLENDLMVLFEVDLTELMKLNFSEKKFKPIPQYPAVKRNLSFILNKNNFNWFEISTEIFKIDPLIKNVDFSEFVDAKCFKDGSCNLCFSITYQSWEKTLKAEEVNIVEKKIIDLMKEKFNAHLRNF
jgi:phenylalanyl-tRNA synthetase beta chain